jgi:hypothetical protein
MENGMPSARKITNHDEIKRWAEERHGRPARVKATAGDGDGGGILRFDFREKDESLEEIPWDQFFEIFDRNGLALLEQEETASGRTSRFFKFVNR